MSQAEKIHVVVDIEKIDEGNRIVYGWFSVYEEGGNDVVDTQGDSITEDEVRKMAHSFIRTARLSKVMHGGQPKAEIVESVLLSRDLQSALGIDLGKAGWFGAAKVHDEAAWDSVKKGELKAFSIGGRGIRRPVVS